MNSAKEKEGFQEVAESLKKYRRADLCDQKGKSILDELYVDLLDGNVILNKCLLDNTTFLIGRKGTGKSTLFLKLENEYRKKNGYLPCYVDVKTVFESSRSVAINQQYLSEYFDENQLEKYLMGRSFIQSVLKQIYTEIDKRRFSLIDKLRELLSGNTVADIKENINRLMKDVDDGDTLKRIEIPVLQQVKRRKMQSDRNSEQISQKGGASLGGSICNGEFSVNGEFEAGGLTEISNSGEEELTNIYLKVFEIKKVIDNIREILNKLQIYHLVILLDDVSEIDGEALKLFVDTVVAPLNNWSEEFIKFKIAFYPGRIHYGKIDPGKVDVINLDFYNLYSEFDINKMEDNAIHFTERLLSSRFAYYTDGISTYFDGKLEEIYELFFRVSMNVPRIMGYILAYLYQSAVIYNKKITKSDIENASERYYEEKIDAFFKSSTYCLLLLDEKRDIAQLKKIRDAIVNKAKEIKRQIGSNELTGRLYQKAHPYSSHFHVLQNADKYLESLELNHFITKYEERSNRDGKTVSIYCINYGLAKKNNIIWGKPRGIEYRTYFIERPFNYTGIILEQIKEVKVIRCSNPRCGRIFREDEQAGLEFTHYRCPDCSANVIIESKIDDEIKRELEESSALPPIEKDELLVLLELNSHTKPILAKDIAEEVDFNSYRISKICKKMERDRGLVIRHKSGNLYTYSISEEGRRYCLT